MSPKELCSDSQVCFVCVCLFVLFWMQSYKPSSSLNQELKTYGQVSGIQTSFLSDETVGAKFLSEFHFTFLLQRLCGKSWTCLTQASCFVFDSKLGVKEMLFDEGASRKRIPVPGENAEPRFTVTRDEW